MEIVNAKSKMEGRIGQGSRALIRPTTSDPVADVDVPSMDRDVAGPVQIRVIRIEVAGLRSTAFSDV